MAFLIEEAYLPAMLTVPPMTDQQFGDFCAEHPDLFFEMTAVGELLVMALSFSLTGFRNSAIVSQLDHWAIADGRGFAGESSGGFVLPNGARRSPDASWVSKTQMSQLGPEEFEAYWHLCPAFVIELRSKLTVSASCEKRCKNTSPTVPNSAGCLTPKLAASKSIALVATRNCLPELRPFVEKVRSGASPWISAPNGIPSRYNSNATCCRASGRVSAGDPLLMARNHLGQ